MAPLKTQTILSLRSKIPFQATPRNTAIHRTLTATAQNSTFLEPRKALHPSSFILPNTSTNNNLPSPLTPRPTTPTNTTSFNTLLNNLTTLLTTPTPPSSPSNLPALHALLRSYTSTPSHWAKYAHNNPKKQYTRNLVTEVPGVFNLLLLVWTPGMRSPVHDHAGSHCLMKVLKGRLREVRWEMPEGKGIEGKEIRDGREGLKEIGRTDFKEGKVAYISDRLGLHEIINPDGEEYAVSLHLYTPPNAATYGCHIYDPATGQSKHVMQGAYDSVRGVVGGS
ncbi:hypothetical protein VTL71DRAFT_6790 [Oculimacula yallundae]|uniref:Cysteine dioxygenase n=1 Tax=Oculimacula yallundae TaxID=86028 RepID=A0ABR4BZN2_9HELO